MNGAANAGWEGRIGLCRSPESPGDVDITAAVGFTFFTIDPSDDVDQKTMITTRLPCGQTFSEPQ